ncbi:MAG: hypothetical protein K6B51_05785 [Bacilli bacterium]|nr:hypothetical protein [Bacilli bacterium]
MKRIVLGQKAAEPSGKDNGAAEASAFEMGGYRAAFSRAKGDMVSLESGGAGIRLRYAAKGAADVGPSIDADGKTAVYEGVEEGIDLRYELEDRRLKESLVIKGRRDEYSFGFEAEIGGLEPSYNEGDNTLELKTGGRVAYRIQAPFMVDSNGCESKKCSYEIEDAQGGRLAIRLVCDAGWINADERAFPVIVDPTIEIGVPCRQFRIYSSNDTNTVNYPDEVFVGYRNEGGNTYFYSFMVDIDLSTGLDMGADSKVYFEIPVNYSMFFGSDEIVVLADWNVIGVYRHDKLLRGGVLRVDITEFLKNGFVSLRFEHVASTALKDAGNKYYRNMTLGNGVFKASLKARDADGTDRARIVIEPKEKCEDCARYDIGASGVTSVNLQTGQYKHEVKGLSVRDGSLSIDADLVFDSGDISEGAYGRGWSLSLPKCLAKEPFYYGQGLASRVTYTDRSGCKHEFYERWYAEIDGHRVYIGKDDVVLSEENELVHKSTGSKVGYDLVNEEGYSYVSLSSMTNYDMRQPEKRYYLRYKGFKKPVFASGSNYLQFIYYADGQTHYVDNSAVEYKDGKFTAKVGGEEKTVFLSKASTSVDLANGTATIFHGDDKIAKTVQLEMVTVYDDEDSGLYTTSEIENLEYEKNQAKYSLSEINRVISDDKSKEYSVLSSIHGVDIDKAIADYNSNPNAENYADKFADGKAKIALYSEFIRLETELISAYDQQLSAERNEYFLTRSFSAKIKEQKESANDYVMEPDGTIVLFDGYGRVAGFANDRENKIKIRYDEDSKIQEIKSEGERVVFEYNPDGKLRSMRKSNGDYVRLYYCGEYLGEIQSNGRKTRFLYGKGFKAISDVNDEIVIDGATQNIIKVMKYAESGTIDAKKEFSIFAPRKLVQSDKYEFSAGFGSTKITDVIKGRVKTLTFGHAGKIEKLEEPDRITYANYLKGKLISSVKLKRGAKGLFGNPAFTVMGDKLTFSSTGKKEFLTRTNAYCLKAELKDGAADDNGGNAIILSVSYVKGGETYNFKQSFEASVSKNLVLPFFMVGEVSDFHATIEGAEKAPASIGDYVAGTSLLEAEEGLLQEYDNEGRLWKIKNNDGKTTYLAFDGKLPIKVEFKDWDGKTVITRCEYDDQGRIVNSVDSDGNVESSLYLDGGKRVEKASYNLKDASLARRKASELDEMTGTYIEKGPIKGTDGEYPAAKTEFYPGTGIAKTAVGLDGGRTEYAIDPRTKNVMAWSKDVGGIRSHVAYSYNIDFLTSVKSDFMEVEYAYDGMRRLKSAKVKGRQKEAVKNTYSDNVTVTDGDGKSHPHGSSVKSVFDGAYEATSEMDEEGRLINLAQIGAEGTCESHYRYSDDGELLSSKATKKTGDNTFAEEMEIGYDDAGRVTYRLKVISDDGKDPTKEAIYLKYGTKGKLSTTEFLIDGSTITETAYVYNDEKLLEKEAVNKDYACEYRYDALKRPISSEVSVCDKFSMARSLSYLQQDGATLDLIAEEDVSVSLPNGDLMEERRSYSYDVNGRIVGIDVDGSKAAYEYDGLGRLIKERNEALGLEFVYSYDKLGNMLSRRGYAIDGGFLKVDDQFSYSHDGTHALSSWNGKAVGSDEFGRITSLDGVSFSWNSDGTLKSAGKAEHLYDSNGVRRIKVLPSGEEVRYVTDGSRILSESRGGKRLDYVYGKDGLMGFYYSGEPYLYERGAQGDVLRVYDRSGAVVAEYAYDAYGNCEVLADVGGIASLNPFRYRGYYFDAETGLYYLNARYYDPRLGRFLSPDSLSYLDPSAAAGMNLYAYCQCDPVNNVDPSGHLVTALILGFVIGAIIGAGIMGYVDYQNDGELFNGDVQWYAYAGAALLGGIIGALAVYLAPASLTFNVPIIQTMASGGAMALQLTSVSVTVSGGAIVGAIAGAGLLAGSLMFSKSANRFAKPGNNKQQNRYIDYLQQKYGFDDDIRRRLHDEITKRGFSKKIIEEILRRLLHL